MSPAFCSFLEKEDKVEIANNFMETAIDDNDYYYGCIQMKFKFYADECASNIKRNCGVGF
jgi:hypothetical protein